MLDDVFPDGGLKSGHRLECSAANASARDHGEEVLDGIKPGARRRGEVEDPPGMIGQPLLDLGMLVRGVVVDNRVDNFSSRNGSLDGVEKFDEFLMRMLGHAASDDGAIEDIESRE